jgi:N-dimethylarginine dimethylaminohydrolase
MPLSGPYPQQVIEEANQDLDKLATMLENNGVKVLRPRRESTGYYNYCPRDVIFAHDKQAIATPMALRSRADNWVSFTDAFSPGELKIIDPQASADLYDTNAIGNPDVLGLTEAYPAFDAANMLKANDDILYLVSNSANRLGAQAVQKLYPDCKVHVLEGVYSYMHIDSTIAFLREGLLMVNPSRITDHATQLPAPFNTWDCIYAPEPTDIGHFPGYCNSSPWINLNLLSFDTQNVILEENQRATRDALKRYGINSTMVPMRHSRTLGGSIHCVTLDLERDHG